MSSQLGIAPSAIKLSAGQVNKQQGSSQKSRDSTCGAQAAYPAHPPAQRGQKCTSVRDRWSCGNHSPHTKQYASNEAQQKTTQG